MVQKPNEDMLIVFYLLAIVIGWILLYFVVKAAVRDGLKEALSENASVDFGRSPLRNIQETIPERPANAAQKNLQKQYDKGEISFDVYQSEWNRLGGS